MPAAVAIVGAPAWGLVADRLGDVRPPLLAAALWAAAAALVLALQPADALARAGRRLPRRRLLRPDAARRRPDGRAARPDRDRFGQAQAFGSLGFMLTTVAVGALVRRPSTLALLAVYVPALALTGIVGAALLGRGTASARASRHGAAPALGLLRDPGLGLFFAGSVVVWVAAAGIMAFFSLRLIELGGDARLVGIGWAANAVLEIPTMLAVPADRRPRSASSGCSSRAPRSSWAGRCCSTVTGSAIGLVAGAALGGVGVRAVPRRHDDVHRAAGAGVAPGDGPGAVLEHDVRAGSIGGDHRGPGGRDGGLAAASTGQRRSTSAVGRGAIAGPRGQGRRRVRSVADRRSASGDRRPGRASAERARCR